MAINSREMESLQDDIRKAHFDIVAWRSKKTDQYDVREFHNHVTKRISELVTICENLEKAGSLRAF